MTDKISDIIESLSNKNNMNNVESITKHSSINQILIKDNDSVSLKNPLILSIWDEVKNIEESIQLRIK